MMLPNLTGFTSELDEILDEKQNVSMFAMITIIVIGSLTLLSTLR